jgi:hypothetical protein
MLQHADLDTSETVIDGLMLYSIGRMYIMLRLRVTNVLSQEKRMNPCLQFLKINNHACL